MGDFTTVDEVKSLFRGITVDADTGDEETNTALTTEELDQFIDETELIVKSRLSTCYKITAIGVDSTKIIGVIVKFKVAQLVKEILELTTSNAEGTVQRVTGNFAKKAEMLLDKICPDKNVDGTIPVPINPLPDTDLLAQAPQSQSIFSTASRTAEFEKGKDNW